MNRTCTWMKRCLSAGMALMLAAVPTAMAESEETTMNHELPSQEEHFVPENPDMTQADVKLIPLDLKARIPAPGQPKGTDTEDGVLFDGSAINKCAVPMPFQVLRGQHITLTITGVFGSENDQAVRVYLTDANQDNCSNATVAEIENNGGAFTATVELIANKPANAVMLATSSFSAKFECLTVSAVTLEASAELMAGLDPSIPYAESIQQDWYQEMLADSWVNVGNNRRLQNVIRRAQNGEQITIATIGGSITEGAGAMNYKECYAYRIYDGFRQTYGVNGGSNVSFVNAGVGGTPSTFGWMRYQRDISDRVPDEDGLADIVVIEYSVNDGGEPTNHQCFESMVKQILMQPNEPVVIILFAVFPTGYNLQAELKNVGETYDLMMVSIKDGPFKQVGTKWTVEGFFFDQYHPTTLGHAVMADCVLSCIAEANARETSEHDIDLTAEPAFGDQYMGIRTIYSHSDNTAIQLNAGSFNGDDTKSYTNLPVGRVCGENFFHTEFGGQEPLTFTASFKNLMIAYRTMNDAAYGHADVYIDGKKVRTLNGNTGSWGQSVVDLLYSVDEASEHTVSICMAEGEETKLFTITCMGYTP